MSHVSSFNSLTGNITSDALIGDVKTTTGNVVIATAGKGLQVKRGTNATSGIGTINGTTGVVVSTTAVTADSIILLGGNAPAGTPAAIYVSAVSAGVSFTIKSAASDTGTFGWLIINPAP